MHKVGQVNPRLKRIRRLELEVFKDVLVTPDKNSPENVTVVELGGGSGYLAREMASMGLSVRSFDPNPRQPLDFPVERAYAHELPLDDSTADLVVGSHVLEHLPKPYLSLTFREIRRALKPSGQAIIVLPTSAAMFLTILLQPLGNLRRLLIHLKRLVGLGGSVKKHPSNNPLVPQEESVGVKLVKGLTSRWLLPAPHGVGKTALHELWNWRRSSWIATFNQSGFRVLEVRSSGLAFSLHQLGGERLWSLRRILGQLGMSGSIVFLLRPVPRRIEGAGTESKMEAGNGYAFP
ncbi:MAG: class I SAM-dependent methyltransferase [Desulfomonilaceae bacterium]|nr:class I SAM-dependent methyltransferase [Desulfomonilaceae bacterium]